MDLGTEWLAREQRADGTWSSASPGTFDVGVTAIVLISFLQRAETHNSGPHKKTVKAAAFFLNRRGRVDGRFASTDSVSPDLEDALATYALCELYGLTGTRIVRGTLDLAIARLVRDGDEIAAAHPLAAVFVALALRGARLSELDVSAAAADAATDRALRALSGKDRPEGPLPDLDADARIAASVYLTNLRGESGRALDQTQRVQLDALRDRVLPANGGGDPWAAYFALFASDHQSTTRRRPWYRALYKSIPHTQVVAGNDAGSWTPTGPWKPVLGRVGVTALALVDLVDGYRDCFWRDEEAGD